MSFITQPGRIFVNDSAGVTKFDSSAPHPIIYSRIQGSVTFSSSITTTTFTLPTREGSSTETRYNSNGINSIQTIYTAPTGVSIDSCLSSFRLTSSNASGTPQAYYYWRMPTNSWISANGSILVDQSVNKRGKLERASVATIYATNNTVVFEMNRTAFNDDVNALQSYTFEYNVLACKVKEV